MTGNDSASATAGADGPGKRFRSEIEFPYSDLESAVEIADTLHSKAGSSCELEELAGWLNQSATGGTFRTRVSAAKMFGLIDTGQGRVTLLQLGRDILEGSGTHRAARIEAFLNVELFRAMYDQYKGNILPPGAAIERQMEQLGVSPKQKERARQTFMKSAQYAGFIDNSSGRLIKPGNGGQKDESRAPGAERETRRTGDDGGGPSDPLIAALIQKLPPQGTDWSTANRITWLSMMTMAFQMAYGQKEQIIIKVADSPEGA